VPAKQVGQQVAVQVVAHVVDQRALLHCEPDFLEAARWESVEVLNELRKGNSGILTRSAEVAKQPNNLRRLEHL
jgi:hypothetical protein